MNGTIQAARTYAVDFVLRAAIGSVRPWPKTGVVLIDGLGRGPVGDAPIEEEPLPWEVPANKERATGLEPATLSLGS